MPPAPSVEDRDVLAAFQPALCDGPAIAGSGGSTNRAEERSDAEDDPDDCDLDCCGNCEEQEVPDDYVLSVDPTRRPPPTTHHRCSATTELSTRRAILTTELAGDSVAMHLCSIDYAAEE